MMRLQHRSFVSMLRSATTSADDGVDNDLRSFLREKQSVRLSPRAEDTGHRAPIWPICGCAG